MPLLWDILVSQAPMARREAPVPLDNWKICFQLFALKERLCEDKSFQGQARLLIKVAGLADLHGDHRSTSVRSHFPGRVSALNLQSLGLEPSPRKHTLTSTPPPRNPGRVPHAHREDEKGGNVCFPWKKNSLGGRADRGAAGCRADPEGLPCY